MKRKVIIVFAVLIALGIITFFVHQEVYILRSFRKVHVEGIDELYSYRKEQETIFNKFKKYDKNLHNSANYLSVQANLVISDEELKNKFNIELPITIKLNEDHYNIAYVINKSNPERI